LLLIAGLPGLSLLPASASAQNSISVSSENLHAGELEVPVNKSQVLRSDRSYARALVGNPEIADVLPLTDRSLYVLGKKAGTTSLTLYDRRSMLIAVVDVVVGPDVMTLRRQLSELLPGEEIGARLSNDNLVLSGIASSAPAVSRAVQIAETYAPGKVVNMISVGASQQVMLEVRFSEMQRETARQLGLGTFLRSDGGTFSGAIGGGAAISGTGPATLGAISDSFGILTKVFSIGNLNLSTTLDALERKGVITTLAEPTLVALSGETANFLAGGEFPVPIAQGGDGDSDTITVEFKPFGVSLAFTPTVLADGVINLVVAPEVSSIDATASISINGLSIPGLQTRRAKTTLELRDGESFAMAGLLRRDFQDTVRQFPLLGSIPIIGTLFRSTRFQKEDTELVIIVTPRLVRPFKSELAKLPTDRVKPPNELELFLLGRTDSAVGTNVLTPSSAIGPAPAPVGETDATSQRPALPAGPVGIEGPHGHDF
jgi:pilus assembly protein CpaC